MKTIITSLILLLLITYQSFAQDSDISFIEIEKIIKDLHDKEKASEFYVDNASLICFDERIHKAVEAIDASNHWLTSDCPTEADIYYDYIMHYKLKINVIRELFDDPDHIESIKENFSHLGSGEIFKLDSSIILNGDEKALFSFTHGKIKTTYLAKQEKGQVVIMLMYLSVI